MMPLMEWLLYLVAALFVLLGAGCLVLIIFSLPGTWIMLGLAAIIEVCDRFYLPEGDRQTFEWWVLIACVALAAAGELLEFAASAAGAKRGGATRRGMIFALIGGILGGIFLTFLLPIPVVGSLIGAIIGTFAGAVVGEMTHLEARTLSGSIKPAIGATIGRVLGTMSKIGIATAVWIALSVDAFWP